MGTSAERSSCNTDYYKRGDVLPGIWVDGMDVLAVRNAFEFAIKHATEKGPTVMEVKTYRLVSPVSNVPTLSIPMEFHAFSLYYFNLQLFWS